MAWRAASVKTRSWFSFSHPRESSASASDIDIVLAFAQRGQGKLHDVQAVIEILAEIAIGHSAWQVQLAADQDTHIDLAWGERALTMNFVMS